jgi:hypothetical protein
MMMALDGKSDVVPDDNLPATIYRKSLFSMFLDNFNSFMLTDQLITSTRRRVNNSIVKEEPIKEGKTLWGNCRIVSAISLYLIWNDRKQ